MISHNKFTGKQENRQNLPHTPLSRNFFLVLPRFIPFSHLLSSRHCGVPLFWPKVQKQRRDTQRFHQFRPFVKSIQKGRKVPVSSSISPPPFTFAPRFACPILYNIMALLAWLFTYLYVFALSAQFELFNVNLTNNRLFIDKCLKSEKPTCSKFHVCSF